MTANEFSPLFPSSNFHPRSVFLAGPTAVGKSEIALALAEKIGGEIISVDSMQVYRGLDIGTAKPSPAERARVPYHLIDICDLSESFDAAKFVRLAQKTVAEIRARKRAPIFCGGTGFYFKAFLDGIGDAPPADLKLRADLETIPLEQLLAELRERDPATFEKIDKKNPRRVVRAIEAIRLTGKPFSNQRANWGETTGKPQNKTSGSRGRSPRQIEFYCLKRQQQDLHARISVRVDEMFRRGLVAETEQLLKLGLAENKTAMQAIGYRQVVEHLRGERTLAETVELVKTRTRQFAKRQLTWFRAQKNLEWMELQPQESAEEFLQRLKPV